MTNASTPPVSWQAILTDLEAAYQAHIQSGRATVGSYTVAGRSMTYQTTADLIRAIDHARREVQREKAEADLAAGLSTRRVLRIRM
ncbi:hypothetical protein [Leptothrix discophora]|uniref:GpW protein n=1 Tax=Leptothrix discophora TaxID=89 RepID=A0ABT9G1I2_LEPDI|nr:hypothetical protein [Leptothrix discophora]MDP4300350.1 hypothetical protein [Leptothrix discophora]